MEHKQLSSAVGAILFGLGLAGCVSNQPKETPAAPPPAVAEKAPEPVPVVEAKPVCKEAPAPTKKSSKKSSSSTSGTTSSAKTSKTAPPPAEPECVPATAPAAAAPAPAAKPAPVVATAGGYDLSKNKPVTDSTKVEAGQGTMVKGINNWEGEITGVPAGNSRFTKLKIGMPQKQVTDMVGEPTDQGAYVTGKAFIPFYFGSDKTRWEMVYKGQGRLIFSNQSGFGTGYYLTWIIHNANEGGYR